MGYFQYAEKVSGFIGIALTLSYTYTIHACWCRNHTIGECVELIKLAEKKPAASVA